MRFSKETNIIASNVPLDMFNKDDIIWFNIAVTQSSRQQSKNPVTRTQKSVSYRHFGEVISISDKIIIDPLNTLQGIHSSDLINVSKFSQTPDLLGTYKRKKTLHYL